MSLTNAAVTGCQVIAGSLCDKLLRSGTLYCTHFCKLCNTT